MTWLVLHSLGKICGIVKDFHTLIEHVHNTIMGQDVIIKLNSLYKIKIQTVSQGLAITSFKLTIAIFF